MNELELLLLRLEDLTEAASDGDVKILAKSLKRYFESVKKGPMGFTNETERTRKS